MSLPLINQAKNHGNDLAIVAEEGQFTYQDLLNYSHQVANSLLTEQKDLTEARIAFMIPSAYK